MKKLNFLLLLMPLLFIGSTCSKEKDDCHKIISVVNNSDNAIYVMADNSYPDTTYIKHSSGPALYPQYYKVASNEINHNVLRDKDCYEAIFISETLLPSDTLMVFIFDAAIIENESWSVIMNEYKVLKRYDLSLADLQALDWTITYP